MMIFDIASFVLLGRLLAIEGLPASRLLIYAWHPLPIWEFAGKRPRRCPADHVLTRNALGGSEAAARGLRDVFWLRQRW